jgi:hypothetical protein
MTNQTVKCQPRNLNLIALEPLSFVLTNTAGGLGLGLARRFHIVVQLMNVATNQAPTLKAHSMLHCSQLRPNGIAK